MEPSESPTRELTLEEAVSLAILLQKDRQFEAAEKLYREALEIAPDHPRALHYAGVLAHQLKRNNEALALIERSLALQPDNADWWSNLGIVLQWNNKFDSAIDAYRRAVAIDPRHANAHNNLGVLLRASGQPAEAEVAYRAAIQLNPEHIDAYTNLGILLNGLKRTEEAAACYCKVVTLKPKHRDARKMLAWAHSTLGQIDEAVKIYEEWLEEQPGDPVAQHMLAACSGRDVPERASKDFIEATFDSFASTFEFKLESLSYRAPALVVAMLEESGLEPSHDLDVLDAGCGTGLCGAVIAPFARRLVGVDLSESMLAHAREKGIYDTLAKAEVTEYLRHNRGAFDLIVSGDALVYFGDLKGIFDAAANALRPNGLFVFTLEHAVRESVFGYQLQPHGRYGHAEPYVAQTLNLVELQSQIVHAQLRMEAGAPVPGLVVRAVKSGSAHF